ncbi:hypothetical protein ACFL1T_04325, partial [Chlamydiota bacterium]
MKKKIANAVLVLIVLCFNVIHSAVIIVPDDYSEIQDAINASQYGDTVLVKEGLYTITSDPVTEDIEYAILLREGINLMGQGPDKTIIEISHAFNPSPWTMGGIKTEGNNRIDGLALQSDGTTIMMNEANNSLILNDCEIIGHRVY